MWWIIVIAVVLVVCWLVFSSSRKKKVDVVTVDEMRKKRLAALEKQASVTSIPTETSAEAAVTVSRDAVNETMRQRRGAAPRNGAPNPDQFSPKKSSPSAVSAAHAPTAPATSSTATNFVPSTSSPPSTTPIYNPATTTGDQGPISKLEHADDAGDLYDEDTPTVASTARIPAFVAKKVTGPLQLAGDVRLTVDVEDNVTVSELRKLISTACPAGHYVRLFHQGRELRWESKLFDHLTNASLICRIAEAVYTISHDEATFKFAALPGDSVQVAGQAVRKQWGVPIALQTFSSHKGPVGQRLGEEMSLEVRLENAERPHVYRWINHITVNGNRICAPNPFPSLSRQWTYYDGYIPEQNDVAVESMSIAAAKVRCVQLHAAGFCFELTDNGEAEGRLLDEEEERTIRFKKNTDGAGVEPDMVWGTWAFHEVHVEAKMRYQPIQTEIEVADEYLVQVNFAEKKDKKASLFDEVRVSLLHVDLRVFSVSKFEPFQLRTEEEVPFERIVMLDDYAVTLVIPKMKSNCDYVVMFPNSGVPFEGLAVNVALAVGDQKQKDQFKWATPAAFEFYVKSASDRC